MCLNTVYAFFSAAQSVEEDKLTEMRNVLQIWQSAAAASTRMRYYAPEESPQGFNLYYYKDTGPLIFTQADTLFISITCHQLLIY